MSLETLARKNYTLGYTPQKDTRVEYQSKLLDNKLLDSKSENTREAKRLELYGVFTHLREKVNFIFDIACRRESYTIVVHSQLCFPCKDGAGPVLN